MYDFAWLLSLGESAFNYSPGDSAYSKVEASYSRLLLLLGQQRVYGVHTQYGNDVEVELGKDSWQKNQLELLEFLSVGSGRRISDSVVRRALRLQVCKVSQGYSGIHPETFAGLVALCNSDSLPEVPYFGSLGASGDLIPMAHAVAPLFESGPPAGPRDVLGLVNTNSMMASLAVEHLDKMTELLHEAIKITSLVSLALGISDESFQDKGFAIVPHHKCRGEAAARIRKYRDKIINEQNISSRKLKAPLQARYSVRCTPHIYGNVLQLIQFIRQLVISEALAVADNPVVLEDTIWHGGHFYTAGLASAADMMADCIGRIGEVCDRQTFLLVTESESNGLPRNLKIDNAGHLKGVHQLCNSMAQRLRGYSVPSRILSGPAESYNQDVVPGSMMALHNIGESLECLREILRCSKFIAERGVALRCGMALNERLYLERWKEYEL